MYVVLTAALLLAQLPATSATDFEATFTPEAVGSHLAGREASLVVGAGSPTPALAAAAKAVEAALRQSGKADLIMNGASLGPVAELDDPALVKRCEPLPVARVLVVRVFEMPGEAPRAVVTVYDRRGVLQSALTAQAGQPLAPGKQAVAQGASPSVAQAVLQASGGAAQEEYERSYLGIDDLTAMTNHGAVVTWSTPYQGKYRRPLDGEEFYRLLGRTDLVQAYDDNRTARTGVVVAGVAIGVGAPLLAYATRSHRTCPTFPQSGWFECDAGNQKADIRAGMIALGGLTVGALVASAALWMRLHPIDPSEARRLADEHNKKLRARLGLAQAPGEEERSSAPALAFSIAPVRGGGAVGLALVF